MTGDQDLEKRVQALEDRLDILQLIMSYPLALDSGAETHCRSAWAETGVFDRGSSDPAEHSGGYQGTYGVETIIEEFNGPDLQKARDHGLAHLMTAPHVVIQGDKAVATNYNQLVEQGDGFHDSRDGKPMGACATARKMADPTSNSPAAHRHARRPKASRPRAGMTLTNVAAPRRAHS